METWVIIGMVGFFVTIICILSDSHEDIVGVICFIGILAFIAGIVGSLILETKKDNRWKDAMKRAEKVCYPRVAENIARTDKHVTFNCAGDSILRIVKP